MGQWLDWLDAVLFADNHDKALGIINWGANDLQIQHGNAWLNGVPGVPLRKSVCDELTRDSSTWLILSCNASFARDRPVNHWVPCVFEEAVSGDVYTDLVNRTIGKFKVKIAELESEREETFLGETPEEDESNQAIRESIEEEIDLWLVMLRVLIL